MGKKLYAPDVDFMIAVLRDRCRVCDPRRVEMVDELYGVLSQLKSSGDDELKSLWLKADRGPIEAYGDFEDVKAEGYIIKHEDFVGMWEYEYPDEVYWYHMVAVEHDGYRGIIMGQKLVLEVDSRMPEVGHIGEQLDDFIHWIIDSAKEAIQRIKDGTYNDDVQDNLPLRHRTGTILRSDMWKVMPETRTADMEGLTQTEIDEYISLMKEVEDRPIPVGRIQYMTARQFLQCCAAGYAANDYEGSNLPLSMQYQKHADGRDEGLLAINPDSFEEFDNWYDNRPHIGHPWEVCRGGNSTHVDLAVVKDEEGYYYWLRGNSRRSEVIRFYLAIRKAGLPVTITNGRLLADVMEGKDKIGIVPQEITPRYCEARFPGERIIEFMHLEREDEERLKDYVTWQSLPKSELVPRDDE